MATLQEDQKIALKSTLQRLSERVDVKTIDDFFDIILSRLGDLKTVSCALSNGNRIAVQCRTELLAEVSLPRAKSVLRLMCARLAVRSAEWANREVSPYGDSIEFELPARQLQCRVVFQNTPDAQEIEISERGADPTSIPSNTSDATTACTHRR